LQDRVNTPLTNDLSPHYFQNATTHPTKRSCHNTICYVISVISMAPSNNMQTARIMKTINTCILHNMKN